MCVGLAAPAAADPPSPAAVSAVFACIHIADASQRLACYDAAAAQLAEAQSAGDVIMLDRNGAEAVKRETFGFTLPSLPRLFGRSGPDAALAEVRMQVAQVSHGGDGRAAFIMSDGQVWQQIDDQSARRVRPGGAVTVRRAALGSYMMTADAGGPALRVRRAQ